MNRGSRSLMDSYFRGNNYSNTPEMEPYTRSFTAPEESIDQLTSKFNAQPVQYRYENGKLIAYKSMAKGPMPEDMRSGPVASRPYMSNGVQRNESLITNRMLTSAKYKHLYGTGNLTSEWVLPSDALTAPKLLQRQVPTSDLQRSMSFRSGIGMANQNSAGVNPSTFWPGSSFNVPTLNGMPGFGRVDYTTGQYNMTPNTGVPIYGRFDQRNKTLRGSAGQTTGKGYWR